MRLFCPDTAALDLIAWIFRTTYIVFTYVDVSVTPAISVGRDGSFIRQKELHDTLPWERETVLASTFSDFKRAWRRNHTSKEQRLQYLQQYKPQHLQQIFRVEIDGMLLNEIIDVLLSGWEEHKACHTMDQMDNDTRSVIHDGTWNVDGKLWVLSCLNAVRHAGQFSTTCMLVPSKTITRLQIFFQDLALKCELDHKWKSQISNIISNGDDLVGLAHVFRVTVL